MSLVKARYFGIGFRLVFAFSVLAFSAILVSSVSYSTLNQTLSRLTEIQQEDMVYLDEAARLNDIARVIISTSFIIISAESDREREQAMEEINKSIYSMHNLLINFPDYNHYFKNLITQINNNLSLLYDNELKIQTSNAEVKRLLDSLFPLLTETEEWLSKLPDAKKKAINFIELRALLYYQFGLAEKLYNDLTYNELDSTILRLEKLGLKWKGHWQIGNKKGQYERLNTRLLFINDTMSREGELFKLKNQLIDFSYQEKFLWENSRLQLHQLSVQIEAFASRVNQRVDVAIETTEKRLKYNMKLALVISFFSLCAAVFFSWFYVKNNILSRIRNLQYSMRSISSGNLNSDINLKGNDEISEMAKDVYFFQTIAQKLEQTNLQLLSLQDGLIQTGKLAALGELSVGITHEISQPLTAVNGHLHSASIWLERKQLNKVKNNLDKISKLMTKMSLITRHLKSFARKSDGKFEKVNVDSVITEALELLGTNIDRDKCKITYEKDKTSVVWANAIRLEQVIVNIVGNALDAVATTNNAHIHISLVENANAIYIQVKDNGEGILNEDLAYIFDPFYSKKLVGDGVGLGLSIAFNIIKDFNGVLSVKSEVGKGTTFTIELQKIKTKEQ